MIDRWRNVRWVYKKTTLKNVVQSLPTVRTDEWYREGVIRRLLTLNNEPYYVYLNFLKTNNNKPHENARKIEKSTWQFKHKWGILLSKHTLNVPWGMSFPEAIRTADKAVKKDNNSTVNGTYEHSLQWLQWIIKYVQAVTDLEIVSSLNPSYTLKKQGLLMQWNRSMQRNPEYSSRNLETHTDGWNLVSKFHWQRIPNPVSGIWIHSLDCHRFPYNIWGKMEYKFILTRSWRMIVIKFTS